MLGGQVLPHGQWFIEDDEGLFFLVFEKLDGRMLKDLLTDEKGRASFTEARALRLLRLVAEGVSRVHALGYALGDFEKGDNIVVGGDLDHPRPVFCDLHTGTADSPNDDFANDVKELAALAKLVLRDVPVTACSRDVLGALRSATRVKVTATTVATLLKAIPE